MSPVVIVEVTDRIGVVTLNRPERLNALDAELRDALDTAVADMSADSGVKVVVLTGAAAPGRSGGFCAGGDVKEGLAPARRPDRNGGGVGAGTGARPGGVSDPDVNAAMLLHVMPKPTIAMIGGPAVGAGCSLAAASDLRFASSDAVMSTNFAPNGLSGDYGGSFLWTRILGTARARQLYFLNEKIDAARALEYGMVHAVVPPDQLREHTMAVAARLARTPGEVLALMKENLNAAEDEVARRRELFSLEAGNQRRAVERLRVRMAGSPTPPSPPPAPGPGS
jgi:2-(1,2-epoxy-1,2-dihydrophenyl)acetyl-CoA isomerase